MFGTHKPASLRRLLLAAFSVVALPPAALMMLLAFWQTRSIVYHEIEANLSAQAESVSAKFRQTLFERVQNAVTWSELNVMQDIAIGDVDRRLSAFLKDAQSRYDATYIALHALGSDGRVVASSEPRRIGDRLAAGQGCMRQTERMALCPPTEGADAGVLSVAIRSRFDGQPIGRLVLLIDWERIRAFLNTAAGQRRALAVFDARGARIAASDRWQAMEGAESAFLSASAFAGGIQGIAGDPWRTVVQQSRASALAPIRSMAGAFLLLLLMAGGLILMAATFVSERVARPVVRLSEYARGLGGGAVRTPPAIRGAPKEVTGLSQALERMAADLDAQQRKLVTAAKLAAVGEFAAVMAHEIRTPLGILRSSAQTIDVEALDPQNRELVGYILSETERLRRLVNALLDSSRTRAPQRQLQDVAMLVERAVGMVQPQARDKDITLRLAGGAKDPLAEVDDEQVLQLLLNLLLNATQILPPGGTIAVSTDGDAENVYVRVRDDGPGIPEADREQIFEPFIHRREGGLGIGLAVVRELARAHGGDVRVLATDVGACFEVRLPRRAAEVA